MLNLIPVHTHACKRSINPNSIEGGGAGGGGVNLTDPVFLRLGSGSTSLESMLYPNKTGGRTELTGFDFFF